MGSFRGRCAGRPGFRRGLPGRTESAHPGASSINVTAGAYSISAFLFHLLEFMDDGTIDVDEINARWRDLAALDDGRS